MKDFNMARLTLGIVTALSMGCGALVQGNIIPDKWHGLAVVVAGFVGAVALAVQQSVIPPKDGAP